MKTIGFFGDSYCSELKAEQGNKSFGTDWDTYIEIIRDRLNLEVVHLGQKGSSVWDLFLLQWKTFKENKSLLILFCSTYLFLLPRNLYWNRIFFVNLDR